MSKKSEVDELLEGITDPEDLDKDKVELEDEDEKLVELKDQVAKLEKKNMGLLKETKSQRRKRQDADSRLDKLTTTVDNILQQKQTLAADDTTGGDVIPETITLKYSDAGDPILDTSLLKGGTKALEDKVANLEALLQASVTQQQNTEDSSKVIAAIVGEDERFNAAHTKYQSARKWVEDKVVEFQNENNIGGAMSSGQALDHVFDEDLEKEFKSQFGDMSIERVVTAEDSQRHFRSTLASIADASEAVSPDAIDKGNRFQKVLQKPSSLTATANQKGAQLSIVERLQNIKPMDILELSDDQVAQIEKALARESD